MNSVLIACCIVVALILIYNMWFRPEYLTDDEIAQSLIARAMMSDPQDSTTVIRGMTPLMRKRYESMVPLPFNPLLKSL